MTDINFKARIHPLRLFSGSSSLDDLPREINRTGVSRVMVISGRTVSQKTNLLGHIESLLANNFAGRFDEIDRHCLQPSMYKAVEAAKDFNADSIVAVGAGTVCMAARIIAIALAENKPFKELAMYYEPGHPPVSPRLLKSKVPIWNVLTTATAAQNGAGATMKTHSQGDRLELFDPKTRATGVFWDGKALSTATESISRAAGLSTLWFSLMRMGGINQSNPLVQADRQQAWRLALDSVDHVGSPLNIPARINMCAASYLHNRDFDHGGVPFEVHWVARVCYALGAGLMSICDSISPGEAYLALTSPSIRIFGVRDIDRMREICTYLPSNNLRNTQDFSTEEISDTITNFFRSKNFNIELKKKGITADQLPRAREVALQNFNADRRGEFKKDIDLLDQVLSLAFNG